jgi:hypothetical protein
LASSSWFSQEIYNPDDPPATLSNNHTLGFLRFLRIKSGNLSLKFSEIYSKELPSPPWEGIKGRGEQMRAKYFLSTPTLTLTLTLPHQGGGNYLVIFNIFA